MNMHAQNHPSYDKKSSHIVRSTTKKKKKNSFIKRLIIDLTQKLLPQDHYSCMSKA